MKALSNFLIVTYLVFGAFTIWLTTLIVGFMFIFSSVFNFMYHIVPFIGAAGIYFLIKHGFNMLRIINEEKE